MTRLQIFAKLIRLKPAMEIAEALGIYPNAVFQWRHKGIPAARVLQLEKLTKGKLTRHQMRPDVFGKRP